MPYTERSVSFPGEIDPAVVREALERILRSSPFRTSRQCQELLRYVVERSLHNEQESLRERVIGIEVFGRSCDYDTSEDPVVRMRAADIRKRLAQYYQNGCSSSDSVRIEIPSGSYRAVFTMADRRLPASTPELISELHVDRRVPGITLAAPPQQEAQQNDTVPSRRLGRSSWIAALVAVLLLLGAGWPLRSYFSSPSPGVLKTFWAPAFASGKPVIIYAGSNAVYRLSQNYLDRYSKKHHIDNVGPEFFVQLPPDQTIPAADLIPVRNTTLDGPACAMLVSLITRFQERYDLRYGSDITVGDLEGSPTVLVGAFNNSWTLKMTSPLRFVFRDGNSIVDTWHKFPAWVAVTLPDGDMTDDYATISRLIDPQDGHVVIVAAGIGSYGTLAAAQFLTNAREMTEMARRFPSGWQNRNLQIVLHAKIEAGLLSSEHIVAMQAW
jgi:hypothetical protein